MTRSSYLIPFAVGWFFGLLNRVWNLTHPTQPIFIFYCLHTAFFPLQGFWNFWVCRVLAHGSQTYFKQMYGLTERIIAPQNIFTIIHNPHILMHFRAFLQSIDKRDCLEFYLQVDRIKNEYPSTGDGELN